MAVEKEMAEWLKAINCKFIEYSTRVRILLSLFISKYNAVGSVPVLGTGSHRFKSYYFEFFKYKIKFL